MMFLYVYICIKKIKERKIKNKCDLDGLNVYGLFIYIYIRTENLEKMQRKYILKIKKNTIKWLIFLFVCYFLYVFPRREHILFSIWIDYYILYIFFLLIVVILWSILCILYNIYANILF